MKKRLLTLFAAALLVCTAATAGPAKRKVVSHRQSDGQTIELTVVGDEHHHHFATLDGIPVALNAAGDYCYATLDDGRMAPTALVAHNKAQRTEAELAYVDGGTDTFSAIARLGAEARRSANARRANRLSARRTANSAVRTAGTAGTKGFFDNVDYEGNRKGLVILVNFSDTRMATGHDRQAFENVFNQEGYSVNGASGSVSDYFRRQSYGKFNLTFDVVGPVTVSGKLADYGGNDSNGDDKDPARMAYEACRLADSQVNFADYDWDGDGEVDQVYLIYAGYNEAEAYYTHPDAVWAHEWAMSAAGYNLTLDGVKVDTYGCSSELKGSSGTNICGIGTPCHEFSHCMGLPDLYDTTSSGAYGMDAWSIMDYGCYNGDQNVPAGYTSFERWVSGWLEPTELKEGQQVSGMQPLAEKAEAYVIYNEANQDEFYLLENRQLVSDDASLQGHGMLVLHVDYDETAWAENTMNDVKSHQRCTVIAADNSYENGVGSYEYDADGDPYPGTSGNTELTNTSTPKASLYNANTDGKKLMNKPITKIAETADGTISFTFRGGRQVFGPTEPTTTDVTSTSFTANWKAAGGAMRYELELKEKTAAATPDECLVLSEDLTLLGADRSDDSNADISSYLDQYLTTTGWTGEKLYEGAGTLKIGSSKKAGTLTSPLLSAPESGSVTVVLTAHPYKNDKPALTLSLLNESGKQKKSATLTADATAQYATFTDVTADYSVSLATTKRAYLDHIAVYDGAFSADDFAAESPRLSAATLLSAATTVTLLSDKTAYTFTGLKPGTAYRWRVRSGNGTALSEWTDWQDVSTLTAEGIGRVISAAALSADTPVTVIAPDGRTLKHTTYGAFKAAPAHHGTYLLRTPLGTVKAVR